MIPKTRIFGTLLLVAPMLPAAGSSAAATPYDPGRAAFQVRIGEDRNPYRVMALFVLPGETISLQVDAGEGLDGFLAESRAGAWSNAGPGGWSWTAPPDPGLYSIEIRSSHGDSMVLNAFVQFPRARLQGEELNGYRIGDYPAEGFRGLAAYDPPEGFAEVTPENRETDVSPHFRLGQFLCKQEGGPPRYVVLQTRFLIKLEQLLEAANRAGHRTDSFHVMSGYRTPSYNAGIGQIRASRHQFGDAADIFIDVAPRDGFMDDLDGNGKVDIEDARLLQSIFEGVESAGGVPPGGIGIYAPNSVRGPFVHVDSRGYEARW